MLILITEKRIRQRSSGDKSLLSELPFVNVLRPEADEQALVHAGFRIFDTRRNFIPARKLPLNYLKYGYENVNRFMIIAKKE
ncbi:hypothetical protein D3C79_928940 [compost metagenome]